MSMWCSDANEDKDKKLKTFWQVKNEKMFTSTIVSKAS